MQHCTEIPETAKQEEMKCKAAKEHFTKLEVLLLQYDHIKMYKLK